MLIEDSINNAIRFHKNGQLDKALALYKDIQLTSPANQVVTALLSNIAQSYFQLSQIFVQMGRVNDSIDSLKQVLAVRNEMPDVHFMLGQLYIRSGNNQQAVEHLRFYLRLVPGDTSGARMLLAHIGEEGIPEKPSLMYLQRYYANYAKDYDEHLQKLLDYKCPQIILQSMNANNIVDVDILDLGCGTGLSGEVVRPLAKRLDGVDISQAMLNVARRRNIYDGLQVTDMYVFLSDKYEAYDVVIAAGLFEHVGNPEQIYSAVFKSLRNNGHFLFTAEENTNEGVGVNSSGFYMHEKSYLEITAEKCGFLNVSSKSVYMRLENNAPVTGLIVVLKKSV